jgi:glycosyltransferase involved in cell wall biosynthesis
MPRMPELSVIIATFNRAERLRRCLEALGDQSLAHSHFEVVVVVDGAKDTTMAMLASLGPPFRLRVVWQENSGQAVALNRGIAEAHGRFCLFLDDDIVVAPECLAEHLRVQQEPGETVGIGQLTLAVPEDADWYARAFAEGWRRHYESLNSGLSGLAWEDCYGGNMSAPRCVLLECGGFDTCLPRGFDVELAYRLEQFGCALRYLPFATGCQDERKGFRELSQDIEAAGAADLKMFANKLGPRSSALRSFAGGHPVEAALKRLLLALRVPPGLLAAGGNLIPSRQHQYRYHRLIQNLCYWTGVRRASRGTKMWSRIKRGGRDPW